MLSSGKQKIVFYQESLPLPTLSFRNLTCFYLFFWNSTFSTINLKSLWKLTPQPQVWNLISLYIPTPHFHNHHFSCSNQCYLVYYSNFKLKYIILKVKTLSIFGLLMSSLFASSCSHSLLIWTQLFSCAIWDER